MIEFDIYEEGNSGELLTFLKAKESKLKKRKHLIPIKSSGLTFGSNRIYSLLALVIILIIIMQLIIYFLLNSKATQLTNMTKLYANNVEAWVNYASMATMIIELVSWNNDVKFWEEDSLEAYDTFKKRLEDVIIPGFAESLDYDLANYTKSYQDLINVSPD